MKPMAILLSLLIAAGAATATIIHVPGDYPTIQAGINAASFGDTVLVAPGTYYENVQLTGGVTAENLTLLGSGRDNTVVDGMGLANVIYAYEISNVTIEDFTVQNSQQSGSAPGNIGIHLNPISSSGTKIVRHCHVKNCGQGIQIWNDFGGLAYIEYNIISDNIYDGFDPYLGTTHLTNNTIVDNGWDGYHDWSGGGQVYIENNVIANNGRYGIYKHLNTPVFIWYNDVWNNAEGAYYQGYSGPPQPFIPQPGTGEIAADPLFAPPPFEHYISWANFPVPDTTRSPCIDAGNPASPPDPDGTAADMGALYFAQILADVTVTLTPYNPPIVIPASGGSFDFNVAITNHETASQTFDAWVMATLPSGVMFGPILGPVSLTLPGGGSIDRDRTQYIPPGAPPGTYQYQAYVGIFPTTIWSGGSFPFDKQGVGEGTGISEWANHGDDFNTDMTERAVGESIIPSQITLLGIYPNPFNPTTAIRYQLPALSFVNLSVYDVFGRKVGELVNGWREAGTHEVIFDGSDLASGIYIYKLSAGDLTANGKMALVK